MAKITNQVFMATLFTCALFVGTCSGTISTSIIPQVAASTKPAVCLGIADMKAASTFGIHNAEILILGDLDTQTNKFLCADVVEVFTHDEAGAFTPLAAAPAHAFQAKKITLNRNKGSSGQTVLPMIAAFLGQKVKSLPAGASSPLHAAVLVSQTDGTLSYLLHQTTPASGQVDFYYHNTASGSASSTPRRSLVQAAACPNGYCYVLKKLPPGCRPKTKGYPTCTKACVCK